MAETVAAALAEAGASPKEIASAMKAALAGKQNKHILKIVLYLNGTINTVLFKYKKFIAQIPN